MRSRFGHARAREFAKSETRLCARELDVRRLVKAQRALSDTALGECDLQRMMNLATQSQLMREAGEAFAPA